RAPTARSGLEGVSGRRRMAAPAARHANRAPGASGRAARAATRTPDAGGASSRRSADAESCDRKDSAPMRRAADGCNAGSAAKALPAEYFAGMLTWAQSPKSRTAVPTQYSITEGLIIHIT